MSGWNDFATKIASGAQTPAKRPPTAEDLMIAKINGAISAAMPFSMGWEAFVPDAYWDDIGKVWTVGHGLTQIPDEVTGKMRAVRKGDKITQDKSKGLVLRNYRNNAADMYKNLPWFRRLSQDSMSAALDTAYNAGWGVFSKSKSPTLTKKMSLPGADPDAAYWSEHDTYASSGGKKVKGLANRRAAARKAWGPANPTAGANTNGVISVGSGK